MTQDGLTLPLDSRPVRVPTDQIPDPTPQPAVAKAFGKALAKAAKQGKQDETGAGVFASGTVGGLAQTAIQGLAHAGPDLSAAAHLDRIAAAIAEAAAAGSETKVHLALPQGQLPISGAILGRDTGGQLTVMLLGQGHVAPAAAVGLATELNRRLIRRQIKAARVTFEKSVLRPARTG